MAFDTTFPVLIVDDYASMRRIMRSLLQRLGFDQVDEAADANEGLAKMRARHYGLVISDWNMEPLSGYEFLKSVRSDHALGKTPFILVTASEKEDYALKARAAGADAYLVKPFAETVLLKTIQSATSPAKAA